MLLSRVIRFTETEHTLKPSLLPQLLIQALIHQPSIAIQYPLLTQRGTFLLRAAKRVQPQTMLVPWMSLDGGKGLSLYQVILAQI